MSPVACSSFPSLCVMFQPNQTACIFSLYSCCFSPPHICEVVLSVWHVPGVTFSTSSSLTLHDLTKPSRIMTPPFTLPLSLYHGTRSSVVYDHLDRPLSQKTLISLRRDTTFCLSWYCQNHNLYLVHRKHLMNNWIKQSALTIDIASYLIHMILNSFKVYLNTNGKPQSVPDCTVLTNKEQI